MKGLFISIEGGDGAGKTTQIENMTSYFNQLGYSVELTREPGGTCLGEMVRDILLHEPKANPSPLAEMFLLAGARAQHLEEKILPNLSQGKVVITDRFSDSMIAYQCFGRQLDYQLVDQMNIAATGGIFPDLTIFLDVPVVAAMNRKQAQQSHILDRIEKEELAFHERVYEGYLFLCQKFPSRICRVTAVMEPEMVFEQIKAAIDKLIGRKGGQ